MSDMHLLHQSCVAVSDHADDQTQLPGPSLVCPVFVHISVYVCAHMYILMMIRHTSLVCPMFVHISVCINVYVCAHISVYKCVCLCTYQCV